MKHTNLPNEITGEYYYDQQPRWRKTIQVIIVLAIVVLIVEWTGLADWLLEILA